MTSTPSRVAVVGIGLVAPGATGVEPFAALLREGRSAIGPVTRFDTGNLRSHRAALVEGFTPKTWIPVMKMRKMNSLSRLGLACAKMAHLDGGSEALPFERERIAISLGTTFGPVDTSAEYLNEYVAKGAALAPPQLFAESVANAPGSHIAIDFGYRGFNLTFTQRESSALSALAFGASQIAKGSADAVVSGGVEEMNEVTFAVLDRIGALAHAGEGLEEMARPFDVRRNGIAVGEGAAVFLLASRGDAVARKPYGWISGFALRKDTTASISDWGEGSDAVAAAMRGAIDDAGLSLSDVDAVWASANGSVKGDLLEQRAIEALFGQGAPPVVATKGFFGEYAGAGALQIASALVALEGQWLPASPGFETGEPGMRLEVSRAFQSRPLRHILVNSLSAGGGIVCAVLSREETS